MFDELDKYKNKGHFFFQKGSVLKEMSKDVPNLPGIYYIYRLCKGEINLVYIGKSGTMLSDGNFKKQGLRDRLNKKQDKHTYRQEYFELKLAEDKSDALDIYWHVTFDEENQDIPSYVEGLLLQHYFEIYRQLPEWNKEY